MIQKPIEQYIRGSFSLISPLPRSAKVYHRRATTTPLFQVNLHPFDFAITDPSLFPDIREQLPLLAMALILNATAQPLAEMLLRFAQDRISMILGVREDLHELQHELELLADVVTDAESRKICEAAVRTWVTNLREILYDAGDLLDDCRMEGDRLLSSNTANNSNSTIDQPSRCCVLSFLPRFFGEVLLRNEIGERIRSINSELQRIYDRIGVLQLVQRQPSMPTRRQVAFTSIIADEDIIGIDEDAKLLVDLIIGGSGTNSTKCLIYAITGMPGIGKTTLAQKIINDPQIERHFHAVIFLTVSNEYNTVDLLNEIGRRMMKSEGKEHVKAESYLEAVQDVRGHVTGKRLLFVLDDVWEREAWERLEAALSFAANGTRVLLTTRNEMVAYQINASIHKARELTKQEAWQMLRRQVFSDGVADSEIEPLKATGLEIVQKCKGLPLAIKTIAGMLKRRDRMDIKAWVALRDSPTWNLDNLGNDIKPGLLLSYEDLPPHLKQCFIYCSLFPEDYRFHHQTLVQMWIAEGLVRADGQKAVEQIGDECYRELVMRNLLQAAPEYYDGKGCTMHDLVRALAHHVSNSGSVVVKPRHLFFVKKESNRVPDVTNAECLRTMILSKNPQIKDIPIDYFEKLRHLRVLDLTYTGIHKLPETLGSLLQLRFLNVAFTKLEVIPDSIGRLRNLETLKANDLKKLEVLPDRITQLTNLRHLVVGSALKQLKSMPVGIRNLWELRTLSGFVVNDNGVCNMEELGELRNVAHISIYKLENVTKKEDAAAAKLAEKENMNFLRLSCTRMKGKLFKEDAMRIEEVLEGLEPHKNLAALHIDGFFGVQLPSYFRNCSLENLNWLRLDDCKSVEQLPPLGRLPMLRALHIWGAIAVSKIGPEFFSGSVVGRVGFPQLREFYLKGMTKLKEIETVEHGALPLLKKLHVIRCPKLNSLPDGLNNASKLTHLSVDDAESIKAIRDLDTVTDLKLNRNSKLKVISGLPSLEILTISNCRELEEVNCSNELKYLSLTDENMQDLPEWLNHITSLRRLNIKGNHNLVTKCIFNGVDWPKVAHVLHLDARTFDESSYISYRKEPFFFQSNLTDDQKIDKLSSNLFSCNDEENADMSFRYPYEP